MLQVTKIFHFETAHAIHGYSGACRNIHGHSYELFVTVSGKEDGNKYIGGTGFVVDFKELKNCVNDSAVKLLDHKLVLSKNFLKQNPFLEKTENLVVWEVEPSAENILIFIKDNILKVLPANIYLERLKIYETRDSFAEWQATKQQQ